MAVLSFPTPTVFRNLDTPTANTDATTKLYVDQRIANSSGSSLTVSEIDGANTITNSFTGISAIRFDKDTGFSVAGWGTGTVKVSLGSTFKTWNVYGQPSLVAVGEDTVRFVSGNGISITTSNTAGNKTITFSANNTAIRLYVANQIAGLVNSAPAVLDTLRELSMAMGNNANFAANVYNSLSTKISNNVTTTISVKNIIPAANNTYSLGSPGRRFKDLYVSSNTIYIGKVSLGVSTGGGLKFTSNGVTNSLVTERTDTGTTSITQLVLQTVLGTSYGGTGLSSFIPNGVMFGANSSVIGFITGASGAVMQITSNGTPAFTDLDGGSF